MHRRQPAVARMQRSALRCVVSECEDECEEQVGEEKKRKSAALNKVSKEKRRCSDSIRAAGAGGRDSGRQERVLASRHRTFNSAGPQRAASRALRLLLFVDDSSDLENTTPVVQIPSPWPPRKPPSALPRRTSPSVPRSARVRTARTATHESHQEAFADTMSQQASSSLALPVSSPPSTTPSSTSPISRTSEQHPPRIREFERRTGDWHI